MAFAERADQRRLALETRRENIVTQQQELHEKTRSLLADSKALQKKMETWLSTILNRVIHIVG